jgi:hypothetical protein
MNHSDKPIKGSSINPSILESNLTLIEDAEMKEAGEDEEEDEETKDQIQE